MRSGEQSHEIAAGAKALAGTTHEVAEAIQELRGRGAATARALPRARDAATRAKPSESEQAPEAVAPAPTAPVVAPLIPPSPSQPTVAGPVRPTPSRPSGHVSFPWHRARWDFRQSQGPFLHDQSGRGHDLEIPGQTFTFGAFKAAQAAGDLAALHASGHRAFRVSLEEISRG